MKRLSQQDKALANKLGIPEEELLKDIAPLKNKDIKGKLPDEDQRFVTDVAEEFNISENTLAQIVNIIGSLKKLIPEKKNHASYKRIIHEDLVRILASPEFKAITIETDTDRIYLSSEDPLFHHFKTAFINMRSAFNREMKKADRVWSNYINGMAMQQLYNYFKYLEQQNISKFNRRAILGLIMVHFGIYPRKRIMTVREWEAGKMTEDNYYDYLNQRLRSPLKKYLKGH